VEETAVLGFVGMDGGHIRNIFGVFLVASLATANRRVFPSVFGWAQSEDEETIAWFTETFYSIYPSFRCVWMTDQGAAMLSTEVMEIRKRFDGFSSICGKHVNKTLQVARRATLRGVSPALNHFCIF
jgi:hypothetical protein